MSKNNVARIKKMSPAELKAFWKKEKPGYRRLISKLTSLLKIFHGKIFRGKNLATASDESDDTPTSGVNRRRVSGGDSAPVKPAKPGQGAVGYGLIVKEVNTPGPRLLKQYIDALGMRTKLDELEAFVDACIATENEGMQALASDAENLYNGLLGVYNQALADMSGVAKHHVPEEVGDLFVRVQKYFNKQDADFIASREAAKAAAKKAGQPEPDYPEGELDYYINVGVKDNHFDFVLNCDISHWPMSDVTTKAKVVVVTVRLTPTEDAFKIGAHVTVLDKIALPYLYSLGTELKGETTGAIAKDLDKVLPRKFALNDVVAFAAPVDMKLDATEVTTLLSEIKGISGVTVEATEITMEYPDNTRHIQQQVFRVLRALPKIKKLMSIGYEDSIRTIDTNVHTYSMSIKD